MINLIKKRITGRKHAQFSQAFLFMAVITIIFTSCGSKKVVYTPRGYNITMPINTETSIKLNEISGICWVDDATMIANNDESGRIFTVNLRNMADKNYRINQFGSKDDYEDIVKVDSNIYVLISDGRIAEVHGYGQGAEELPSIIVAQMPGKNNEFESMYYDKEVHSLILLCKSCHKEKDQDRTAYRFDLATKMLIDSPFFRIDINEIRRKLEDGGAEFRPSAAAINPIQNKLYIVSSIGKLLVITDKRGKVEHAMRISRSMFPQPEGITFASNGDMYISNEAAEEPTGTILKFLYKP